MKQRVKIKKIGVTTEALSPTPKLENYQPGKDNGAVSLPVEYYVEGYLIKEITLGESVVVDRYARNGIPAIGTFISSPVINFDSTTFKTYNSIYSIEYLTT